MKYCAYLLSVSVLIPQLVSCKRSSSVPGRTALHVAVLNGDTEQVKLLIKSGANVDAKQIEDHFTALHMAAIDGHEEIVGILLSHGADVNARLGGPTGSTLGSMPLHMAASKGNVGVCRLLVEAGADVNAVEPATSLTPLHKAVLSKNTELVHYLLENGARASVTSKSKFGGQTPADLAKEAGLADLARELED